MTLAISGIQSNLSRALIEDTRQLTLTSRLGDVIISLRSQIGLKYGDFAQQRIPASWASHGGPISGGLREVALNEW